MRQTNPSPDSLLEVTRPSGAERVPGGPGARASPGLMKSWRTNRTDPRSASKQGRLFEQDQLKLFVPHQPARSGSGLVPRSSTDLLTRTSSIISGAHGPETVKLLGCSVVTNITDRQSSVFSPNYGPDDTSIRLVEGHGPAP